MLQIRFEHQLAPSMRGLLRERERKNLVRVSGLVVKVREREREIIK